MNLQITTIEVSLLSIMLPFIFLLGRSSLSNVHYIQKLNILLGVSPACPSLIAHSLGGLSQIYSSK